MFAIINKKKWKISESGINIYPNPFSSETTVQANIPMKNATLTVHNNLGQQIMQLTNIYGNTVSLKRGGLSSGLYFIRLKEDNKILATKNYCTRLDKNVHNVNAY